MLYHLLPVTFWLLAIGGIVIWELFFNLQFSVFNYVVAALALLSTTVIRRIPRHSESVEECFIVALLLGIASYWLPSVVFLLLPVWGYLVYQNIFSFRSFLASLIGLGLVAVWMVVLEYLHLTHYTLHLAYNLYAWLPTGAVLLAWLGTTIVRQNLRVR